MKYFSMFSGIGGFEHGIEQAWNKNNRSYIRKEGGFCSAPNRYIPNPNKWEELWIGSKPLCVGYSEIDKYASAIYSYHYPNHTNYGDATEIDVSGLPDFELLVGGFPCQAFSIAGKRGGFKDTRGTLFFDVARVLEGKRPEWFLLENVKGLCSHDGGRTLGTIYRILTDLGYTVGWEVVNSCQFGVPQNRERIFIVGHLTAAGGRAGKILPVGETAKVHNGKPRKNNVANCLDKSYHKGWLDHRQRTHVVSGTWRTHKDGRGFRELENPNISPCIPARAREDGSGQPVIKAVLTHDRLEKRQDGRRFKENNEPSFTLTSQDKHGVQVDSRIRRLTPTECERLQGFPDGWTSYGLMDGEKVEISDTQRYKALGNAVTVNVIEAIVGKIMDVA